MNKNEALPIGTYVKYKTRAVRTKNDNIITWEKEEVDPVQCGYVVAIRWRPEGVAIPWEDKSYHDHEYGYQREWVRPNFRSTKRHKMYAVAPSLYRNPVWVFVEDVEVIER